MPTSETYTYDPTDDAVLVDQAEQRDAETLEIGEKMVAEQEQLLAGKYKTTEDLENAYLELQKKQGQPDDTSESSTEKETLEYEPYTDDGSVNYDSAKEIYGDKLGSMFQDAKIDPFEMNEHFYKNNGTLSDDMYENLSTAGLTRDVVDSYLTGIRQQAGYQEAESFLSDQEVDEVHALAGGTQGYNDLMAWAGENLSQADADNYDQVVETGNKAAVTFAVKALMAQYEDAVGRDSDLLQGKNSRGESYRSMAEVVRDMNNPLYDSDESYRDDVRRKLQASDIKL